MSKKYKKIFIYFTAIAILTLLIITVSIAMVNNSSGESLEVKAERAKLILENITKKQFGDINFNKTINVNGKELICGEDNLYTYKSKASTGELYILRKKEYDKSISVENKGISKSELEGNAFKVLKQYYPVSDGCSYQVRKYWYKDTDNEKTHRFEFDEVAANGVKTGKSIAISLNNSGDLVLMASHDGNLKFAVEITNKISKDEAINICSEFINSNVLNGESSTIKINKAELTVWSDKLSWHIETGEITKGSCSLGFKFFIDANNGEILFKENYTVVNPQ